MARSQNWQLLSSFKLLFAKFSHSDIDLFWYKNSFCA